MTDGVRDELQLPLDAGEVGVVPDALASIVLPYVRDEALIPIAEVRTERTPYLLYNAEGTAIAEMVDDRVAVIDDGVEVERYREIEVEALVDGAPLEGIVNVLIDAGATRSTLSKAAAALGPDADGPPDVPSPQLLVPTTVHAKRSPPFCASTFAHSSLRTSGCAGISQTPYTKCASPRDACAAASKPSAPR